jgi:ABC-2 type transport system permease protein
MNTYVHSTWFMLRHELRLHWRSQGVVKRAGLLAALLLLALHLIAWPVALIFDHLPPLARSEVLLSVSIGLLCGLLMMLSTSLIGVIKMVYERRDFDLLLSSPLDPHAIVMSRLVGVMASSVALALFLAAPFANMFALMGRPQFLALYPAIICLALLAASISLLLAEGLFRLVGARHARCLAQVFGIAIATALAIAINLLNLVHDASGKAFDLLRNVAGTYPEDSWIWLPARAALGERLPLAAVTLLAVALFVLTALALADSYLRNARTTAGTSRSRTSNRGAAMRPFRGGAANVMRRKELRLLARDPYLLAQVMYQITAIAPVAFILWKSGATSPSPVWLSLVMIAGIVSANLAWLTMSAEDSPDLLAVSPLEQRAVLRAKLEAALIPVGVLLAAPIAAAAVIGNLWLGLTLLLCSGGSAISTALLHLRYHAPAKRSDFNKRANGDWRIAILEFVIVGIWLGAAALMLASAYFVALPLLFAFVLILRSLRRRGRSFRACSGVRAAP